MAKKFNKDQMFEIYFESLVGTLYHFEGIFQVNVVEQVCGRDFEVTFAGYNTDRQSVVEAKSRVRASDAWHSLSRLYDYAVDGIIESGTDPDEFVLAGAEVLEYLTDEQYVLLEDWGLVVTLGDARFALDEGDGLTVDKLAVLAGVDVRTVRNALSAGQLTAEKVGGDLFIENNSARTWLSGRRGFVPTRKKGAGAADLRSVATPTELGAFLTRRKVSLHADPASAATVLPFGIDTKTVAAVEGGSFPASLDAVFPLADYYQVDRYDLLDAVMRVFFPTQLSLLKSAS